MSIQLKNCSAMRKSNEHTKFLPQNAKLNTQIEKLNFSTVDFPFFFGMVQFGCTFSGFFCTVVADLFCCVSS